MNGPEEKTPPNMATVQWPSTPAPGPLAGSGGDMPKIDSSISKAVKVQDLSTEKLLQNAPRVVIDGMSYPSLGGLPILRKIGQGGMAAVYYSIHPRLKQELAIKVMPYQLASEREDTVGRFLREAQIAANIRSPFLIHVSDVNEEAGLFYLVMEYVNGISAGAYIRETIATGKKGLDEPVALDICIAACEGLKAAHTEGIIHRDLKPDNILVPYSKDGSELMYRSAKLGDLGLARHESGNQALTVGHTTVGTPGFMSPEQAMNSKKATRASDVFSMGATLYCLLCGEPPFMGESQMETVLATIQNPHTPISKKVPGTSMESEDLIDRCLCKEAAPRFDDASDLLQALKACRAAYRLPTRSLTQTQRIAVPKPPSGAALATAQTPATPKPIAAAPAAQAPASPVGSPRTSGGAPVVAASRVPQGPAPSTRGIVRTPPAQKAPVKQFVPPPAPDLRRAPPMAHRDDELLKAIQGHVRKHIGDCTLLFDKSSTPLVHIDVLYVKPMRNREFHTIVTAGMSVKPMAVPQGKETFALTELVLCLPAEWPMGPTEIRKVENYWPLRWLMQLARLPYDEKQAVLPENTLANGNPPQPLGPNTQLSCLMLLPYPALLPHSFKPLKLDIAKWVQFLSVIPIHNDERNYKKAAGTDKLLELLRQNKVTDVIDIKRKSVVPAP